MTWLMQKYARSSTGFSLIEVNLAILLVAVGLLALFSLFPLGLKESERGLADTQEAMFADTVLSAMEGAAISITNWSKWTDINAFKTEVKKGIYIEKDNVTYPVNDSGNVQNDVTFPSKTRYRLRYKLKIDNVQGDPARKRATLHVMHGKYGDFALSSVYFTDFVYMGM